MKGLVSRVSIAITVVAAVLLLALAWMSPAGQANTIAEPSVTPAALLPIVMGGYGAPLTPEPGEPDLIIADLLYESTDEQVLITNQGTWAQDMTGWRIYSVVGEQWYDFPDDHILASGVTVYVHSGPDAVSNPPTHLLWATSHMWNNLGDEAVLYDDGGQEIDSSCYGDACP